MDAHQKLVKRIATATKKKSGEFVQTTDGRTLFLTTTQLKRATLSKDHRAKIARLWSENRRGQRRGVRTAARRSPGCRGVMKWLLSNDPFTQFWRETYVEWVNHC